MVATLTNPPIKGPKEGPIKIIAENIAIGKPFSCGAQISLKVPPTLVIGALAAIPAIILALSKVARFVAKAQGKLKTAPFTDYRYWSIVCMQEDYYYYSLKYKKPVMQ